jgi:hypothetical protein
MQFVVFWNIDWLKQRLRDRPLSGKETYIYTFCWLAFLTVVYFSDKPGTDSTGSLVLEYIDAAIPLAGILYAWLCNGGLKGRDFWTRFISLGWVVTMRVLVFSLPLFFVLAFAPMEQSAVLNESAAILVGLFLIWRLGYHMEQLHCDPLNPENHQNNKLK